ncbi:MAG: SoxR reducing system RseC family protein [Dechloromonas sp.]|nr:SoxR reducing system RseC family protein [Dechloromonas sp.]
MSEQATRIQGIVRSLDGDSALVEVAQGGCGRCHEEGGCGGQSLTQMFCSGPRQYRVDNASGAQAGEQVVVAVPGGAIRQAAHRAYGVPIAACLLGGLLGQSVGGDLAAMAGALTGLALAFIYLRLWARQGGRVGQPYIISRHP